MNQKYMPLKKKLRKIAPVSKYGYLGYLLSPDHSIKIVDGKRLIINGGFSFNIGYNCIDVNRCLYRLLEERGIRARFQLGIDSKNIFKHHYFCRDNTNQVIDATPLFSFYGENHLTETTTSVDNHTFLRRDIRSFLTVYPVNHEKSIVEINTEKDFLVKGLLKFSLGIALIDSYSHVIESFEVDLRKYRKDVAFNDRRYLLETSPEIKSKGFASKPYSKGSDISNLEKAIQQHYHARNAFVHKMAYCSEE